MPDRLLDLIYDAATDIELWPFVLTGIADLTNSEGGVLYFQSTNKVYFSKNGRLSTESDRIYQERHVANPWNLYMSRQPTGAVVLSDEAVPLAEIKKTAFFDEVLRPQQNLQHNLMVPLAMRPELTVAFNICRTQRQGPFTEQHRRFVTLLTPHMCRSIELGFRVAGYKQLQLASYSALDQLSAGVILLDRKAKVLFANATARALGSHGGPLRLRNSGLTAIHPSCTQRLNALIQAALQGKSAMTMAVVHPLDGRLVNVLVSAVRSRDIERFDAQRLNGAAVMLFLFDPLSQSEVPAAWIIDAYGLTAAEAKIALITAAGHSVVETAQQLNLSINTVKTHLRRVFVKTEVGRQSELAALLASLKLASNGAPLHYGVEESPPAHDERCHPPG